MKRRGGRPQRTVVHRGRVTESKPATLIVRSDSHVQDAAAHAVAKSRAQVGGRRLQMLVDASPEARAAMAKLGAAIGAQMVTDGEVVAEVVVPDGGES